MSLDQFIKQMPKVELHVHLEGSIRPETLLLLAERNQVPIPANSVEALREWYRFTDFAHFIEIYLAICNCIRKPDDFELITTEFLTHQAEQNIRYSEVIFTPYTHLTHVAFDEQLAAINRARIQAETNLGVMMGIVPDISRQMRPIEESYRVADWAAENMDHGIIALGLGGPEIDNPPEIFEETFQRIKAAGLPSLPHAGETVGPESVWGAIRSLNAVRIGHGVRCLEDPELVTYLREKQIPLDVSPTSNVCLKVASSIAEHPLPRLLEEGIFVTINSDDPAMFGTSLTNEYQVIAKTFGFRVSEIEQFVLNGINASLLPEDQKQALESEYRSEFVRCKDQLRM